MRNLLKFGLGDICGTKKRKYRPKMELSVPSSMSPNCDLIPNLEFQPLPGVES